MRESERQLATFETPLSCRYLEFDQQGVVFNMWYLAYFEDGRNAFLAHVGYSLERLLTDGYDIQLVHTEIDWQAPVRYGHQALLGVSVDVIGNTSFALNFTIRVDGVSKAHGKTVYVIVNAKTLAKSVLPPDLRFALQAERLAIMNGDQ